MAFENSSTSEANLYSGESCQEKKKVITEPETDYWKNEKLKLV